MFLNISGFGDPDANGIYEEVGTSGGYPYYQKDEYFIVYRSQFMPYTVEGAYWLFKTVSTNGSKPIEKTEYVNFSTDINGEWISVLPQSSGEASAGTITEVMSSSSSFEPNSESSRSMSSSSLSESSLSSKSESSSSEGYSESSSTSSELYSESSSSFGFTSSSSSFVPSTCPNDYPEVLVSVSGASGTINWLGETWNLPADSGQTRTVCPTNYTQRQIINTTNGSNGTLSASNRWYVYESSILGLCLTRDYKITLSKPGLTTLFDANRFQNKNRACFVPGGVFSEMATDMRFQASDANISVRPSVAKVFPTTTTYYNVLNFGMTAEDPPTFNNYNITDTFFGSYTFSGITYTWSRGNGW